MPLATFPNSSTNSYQPQPYELPKVRVVHTYIKQLFLCGLEVCCHLKNANILLNNKYLCESSNTFQPRY